ncbi:hypothetical protein N7448_002325 [Penicillium atrosanguineum]|uniref:Uncharacterized protein n=1 Tax=Penicillium atrosanguineum TaxID=1132637 RepID=A0A9W9PVS0_9EURO|nr:NAD(P)-binding protein [Penicillium atrosanguineum]KAJ5128609.1 hypothetical protein N7526_006775 [Penicillium atrosanguineum]KAJ5144933.1 hypothetical protein N7448_002325 [Penicillium atrosanguineum]KAJ5300727.1 NAD(P)-binding protein [Penicillium atrosanguineum]KAJ5311369.1 hypothetical protein N7476_007229 [Penicillium atrosanguineum]
MFGTLVSTDIDRETLEYIENPDPVAAVSRNVQDNIRIASIGLECVYPENQGRNKRQENSKSHRTAIRRNSNVPTQIVCDEAEPCARDGHAKYGQELAVDDLHDNKFDGCIDESLFTPWIMDTPMQHSLDSRSCSSSSGIPTPRSRSATVAPPDQLPELSTADMSLVSLLRPSTTASAGDSAHWQGPHMAHDDISWATAVDGHGTVGPTSEPLSREPWGKTRTESDSCCLLSSVSFLSRLSSRTASRENRIDLLLADVRNSIETLAIFISCERCAARVEQNMLLAMAARQIGAICGKMANCCKAMHRCGLSDTDSSQQKPEFVASPVPIDISVSTYRVSRRERLHLLESLVTLQIMDFQRHINTIKSRYRNRPNKGQAEALNEAENYVKLAQVSISNHL